MVLTYIFLSGQGVHFVKAISLEAAVEAMETFRPELTFTLVETVGEEAETWA